MQINNKSNLRKMALNRKTTYFVPSVLINKDNKQLNQSYVVLVNASGGPLGLSEGALDGLLWRAFLGMAMCNRTKASVLTTCFDSCTCKDTKLLKK